MATEPVVTRPYVQLDITSVVFAIQFCFRQKVQWATTVPRFLPPPPRELPLQRNLWATVPMRRSSGQKLAALTRRRSAKNKDDASGHRLVRPGVPPGGGDPPSQMRFRLLHRFFYKIRLMLGNQSP